MYDSPIVCLFWLRFEVVIIGVDGERKSKFVCNSISYL